MKTMIRSVLVLALLASPFIVTAAIESKTYEGEPVDIQCYLGGKSGLTHAGCAKACAKKGIPVGFVVMEDDKPQLYLVLGEGGKSAEDLLAEHMGKKIKVTGKLEPKEGMNILKIEKVHAE